MSKELTEQWREGTLPRGYYYYKTKVGVKVIGFQLMGFKYPYNEYHRTIDSVEEVLDPVLSYPDLCELKQELEICKDEKADLYAKLCNALMRLEEANKVLSGLITPQTPSLEPVTNYLEKWGVK